MPVKRRTSKRRIDPETEYRNWQAYLESGCAFAGELEAIGFPEAENDPALPEAAREAWHRLGARVIAEYQPTPSYPRPWGLSQFGEP